MIEKQLLDFVGFCGKFLRNIKRNQKNEKKVHKKILKYYIYTQFEEISNYKHKKKEKNGLFPTRFPR